MINRLALSLALKQRLGANRKWLIGITGKLSVLLSPQIQSFIICEHTFTVFAVISFLTSAYVVTSKSFVDTRSSILTGITQARFYICFEIEKQLCKGFYGTDNSLTNFIVNVLWVRPCRKHNRRREKGAKLEEKPMLDINATRVFGKSFIFVRNW